MITDSKLLVDVITGNNYTTEKRLMVDIASIREAYNDHIISNIALIRSEHNAAGAMTKVAQNTALQEILYTHSSVSSTSAICHRYKIVRRQLQGEVICHSRIISWSEVDDDWSCLDVFIPVFSPVLRD